jgi:predicted peptidase
MKQLQVLILAGIILFTASCKKDKKDDVEPGNPNEIIETKPHILTAEKQRINNVIGGYYSGLPNNYARATKKYPALIFLHGAGQFGDGNTQLQLVLNDAAPKLLNEKKFPANIKVDTFNYSLIVLAPQFSKTPTVAEIKEFIQFAKSKYRIDESRIYLSGLSLGGIVSCDYGAVYGNDIAAIVPISGTCYNDGELNAKTTAIVNAKIPVWVFHNDGDPDINSSNAKAFVASINSKSPVVPAKITLFPFPYHDAWTRAATPDYKEEGINMYEWMLKYKK